MLAGWRRVDRKGKHLKLMKWGGRVRYLAVSPWLYYIYQLVWPCLNSSDLACAVFCFFFVREKRIKYFHLSRNVYRSICAHTPWDCLIDSYLAPRLISGSSLPSLFVPAGTFPILGLSAHTAVLIKSFKFFSNSLLLPCHFHGKKKKENERKEMKERKKAFCREEKRDRLSAWFFRFICRLIQSTTPTMA